MIEDPETTEADRELADKAEEIRQDFLDDVDYEDPKLTAAKKALDQVVDPQPPSAMPAELVQWLGGHFHIAFNWSWTWAKLQTSAGEVKILILDTPSGRTAVPLDSVTFPRFLKAMQQLSSGLVLP